MPQNTRRDHDGYRMSGWELVPASGVNGVLDMPGNSWQSNGRAHSWSGESQRGAILLLPWWRLILRWRLWISYYHKMLYHMGQIQLAPVHLHFSFIIHHLQRKGLQFVSGVPYSMKVKPGCRPCLICIAYNAMAELWVSSQDLLERMQLHDLAKILTNRFTWHGHFERSNGWFKKVQIFIPTGGCGRAPPRENPDRSDRQWSA